ncbi:DUF1289 domain-containing protein [Vibrio pacinii]|uniref:DUF1289 domain-containing protein n=1 Tax=Vibrio pacinii TaxID=170674 RepID=UPI0005716847|nr:DUF1289 domain-containing protein [Vibrio pacinii]
MTIPSSCDNPCIGVCQTNSSGMCIGCGRSREERYQWYKLPEHQRREILFRLEQEPLIAIDFTQLI